MQTSPIALGGTHEQTALCREGFVQRRRRERRVAASKAVGQQLTVYGDELERVEEFKYLGRVLSMEDDDTHAVRDRLAKARRVWNRISNVLKGENASPRVCGVFYLAVVQSTLLYSSET